MKPLGIYVQVPFCQTKCTYCNFHTGVVSPDRFAPYTQAVGAEIREFVSHSNLADSVVDTIYIGGGTPSLLDSAEIARILETIRESFRCELTEVTLEADPETITGEKAGAWIASGINRISFGLQSFSDKELIAAGRMHRRADIFRAVPLLRAAGIHNISFDLIAGLAHQTRESWELSLASLSELSPQHVSVYVLEIDEGSRLGAELLSGGTRYGAKSVPLEEQMAEFYERAQVVLRESGYHHYEISNWAKPGFESRHNLKYWQREPYVGFGAGAHSFLSGERWSNRHDARDYVELIASGGSAIENRETVTPAAALEEELFLGLRQLDGIDLARIEKQYGVALAGRFDPLTKAGMVVREDNLVKLAENKLSISNEAFVELLR